MKSDRMRVVQVPKPNGPLELVEREIPAPGAGAVRLKVQARGVCHSDSLTKEGAFPGLQYPRVPGHEVAGVIDRLGPGVRDVDRFAGYPRLQRADRGAGPDGGLAAGARRRGL